MNQAIVSTDLENTTAKKSAVWHKSRSLYALGTVQTLSVSSMQICSTQSDKASVFQSVRAANWYQFFSSTSPEERTHKFLDTKAQQYPQRTVTWTAMNVCEALLSLQAAHGALGLGLGRPRRRLVVVAMHDLCLDDALLLLELGAGQLHTDDLSSDPLKTLIYL